jgi:pimeloyl-ACP methyl ester carboxylesterase
MHEEAFELKNRKGKRIVGALRTPEPNKKIGPKGVFVLLHGLGGWKDQYLLVTIAEHMRADGYYVVTFDAADGAKGPDADFSRGTTSAYVEDLEDVFAHIQAKPWYGGEIVLAAHSQGGLVATRFADASQKEISKLVLIAPAVSWKVGLPWTIPFGIIWILSNWYMTPGPGPARTMLPLRRSWLLDFMRFNAPKHAKQVTVPTLIISGEKDETVGSPKVQAKFASHFTNATHVVIKKARHIFYRHEREVADTIESWLTSS